MYCNNWVANTDILELNISHPDKVFIFIINIIIACPVKYEQNIYCPELYIYRKLYYI